MKVLLVVTILCCSSLLSAAPISDIDDGSGAFDFVRKRRDLSVLVDGLLVEGEPQNSDGCAPSEAGALTNNCSPAPSANPGGVSLLDTPIGDGTTPPLGEPANNPPGGTTTKPPQSTLPLLTETVPSKPQPTETVPSKLPSSPEESSITATTSKPPPTETVPSKQGPSLAVVKVVRSWLNDFIRSFGVMLSNVNQLNAQEQKSQ
ncbi:protein ORF52 [Cyprinid herpesvirus 1]|uniref:Protein ORF52 n=1 Tax=Cyprinid herpesvirus 1 TaxID=317858 RepID=K7PC65_9VIRU|nr:protein ORF52 [Cyprinid herpesvirus 1]AFJ20352.1 protein ORF52 [Cyprinid herpesvirus 1]